MTTQVAECQSADAVLKVVEGSDLTLSQLDEISLNTCVHTIAKLHKTVKEPLAGSKGFEQIIQRLRPCANIFSPKRRSLAPCVISCGP